MPPLEALLRDAAVRAGWHQVELLERLAPEGARALLADHLAAQRQQAERELRPLQPWNGVPDKALRVYTRTPDQVRFRRVLDLIEPGDRVFDIGAGHGYLTGVILRDAQPSYYCGIDLREHIVESAKAMMAANDLEGSNVHLEPKDLYTLTPEWVAEHQPDVLTCLEVLEHVPDAAGALTAIGTAMPEHAALVFSVPLLGRLEACWGHVSLFDADRVRQMCEQAGLQVQHVEPLYNTWILVVASRSRAPLPRLARLHARPLAAPPRVDVEDAAFHRVPLTATSVSTASRRSRVTAVDVRVNSDGAHVDISAANAPGSARRLGGLLALQAVRRAPRKIARHLPLGRLARGRWPVGGVSISGFHGLRGLRLELGFRNGPLIRAVHVTTYDGAKQVAAWLWTVEDLPPSDALRTVVLRPGKPTDGFVAAGGSSDHATHATRVEICVEVLPGSRAGLTVTRAAYVR
jgi:2-polyprenyl-3-methyl-5-hydroxy-6-metoxy-1,4-benzoquinol methylase